MSFFRSKGPSKLKSSLAMSLADVDALSDDAAAPAAPTEVAAAPTAPASTVNTKKKTPEKPALKPKAKEKTGKKPDPKQLKDEKEVVEKTEEKPTKPKSGLKRPAAAAKPSPAKKPAADIPKKKLNVCISLYKRDGVWSCKLNGKEVIRVSCLVKAFFKHMSNWWKPVILELHALRCHCGVKVGMVSLDIVFWYLRWSQLIKYLLKRSHQ